MCTSMWPTQLCLGINSLESWKRSLLKKIIFIFHSSSFCSYNYHYNKSLLLDQAKAEVGEGLEYSVSQTTLEQVVIFLWTHTWTYFHFIFYSEIPFNHGLTLSITSGVPFLCQKSKGRGQLNVHKRKTTVPSTWTVINVIPVTENLVIHIIFTSCLITWRHQETTS